MVLMGTTLSLYITSLAVFVHLSIFEGSEVSDTYLIPICHPVVFDTYL